MAFSLGSPTGGALTAANAADGDKIPIVDVSVGSSDSANKTLLVSEARSLMRPLLTQLRRTAAQTLTTGATTAIIWDTEVTDAVNAWVSGSPTRITVPSGYTQMRFSQVNAAFASNGTGIRYLFLKKNNTTFMFAIYASPVAGDATTLLTSSWWLTVTPGDYFEVLVIQTSGGNLNTDVGTGYETVVEVEWLP